MNEEMSFEEALAKIEEIIKTMESGKLPLEETIAKYQEGVKLINFCQAKLDSYEKIVTAITENNGVITEEEVFSDI
ncbi:MAG: exodeoxyribonuclease VII small subunit [Clostridiaceae bacterium]|jgi:exodeoxyribonuclease VII small subunit|nr:exodeoxyribonuclease VII small subunit [Clostridiaceae bacterium]